MSLITRCPACGTLFKVVPDQLRISEGWVRCGHCADVFDAAAHLQGNAAQPQVDAPADAPILPAAAAAAASEDRESEAFASSLNTEIGEGMPFEAADSAQIDEEAQALVEHPLDQPFELRRRGDSEIEASRPPQTESELESEIEAGLHDVSFVRDAGRESFWARPRLRAAPLVAVIALAMLLAWQIAVHDRDRLAAAHPALRPLLASLCGLLNCRIGPTHQIDAIAIDSSSFNKLRGDTYRLNVTLKNQSGVPVATPALELTLTDGQDQALVRRVLMPAELGPAAGVIAAASEWSGSLAMAVAANGTGARIAGYRLLAFYP
jgi:predicted Zn finger-like uncharacterized protein